MNTFIFACSQKEKENLKCFKRTYSGRKGRWALRECVGHPEEKRDHASAGSTKILKLTKIEGCSEFPEERFQRTCLKKQGRQMGCKTTHGRGLDLMTRVQWRCILLVPHRAGSPCKALCWFQRYSQDQTQSPLLPDGIFAKEPLRNQNHIYLMPLDNKSNF